jgi:hypothetical protein
MTRSEDYVITGLERLILARVPLTSYLLTRNTINVIGEFG